MSLQPEQQQRLQRLRCSPDEKREAQGVKFRWNLKVVSYDESF